MVTVLGAPTSRDLFSFVLRDSDGGSGSLPLLRERDRQYLVVVVISRYSVLLY